MESQNIEVTFPTYNRQANRLLRIFRELESLFSRTERSGRSQMCFQIEKNCIHIFTAQSKWLMASNNSPFMLATLKNNFYAIKNPPEKTMVFGVRVGDFISKILICKKEVEEIKLVISKDNLYLYISDRNSNGYINYEMRRLPQQVVDFEERKEDIIDLGELSLLFLEVNKKNVAIENVCLQPAGMTFVQEINGFVYSEQTIQPPTFLNTYRFEDFCLVLGNKLRLRLFHSISKHCALYKNLGFTSVKVKLYPLDLEKFDEAQLLLEFQNEDYHLFKNFPCELQAVPETAPNIINTDRRVVPTVMQPLKDTFHPPSRIKQQQIYHQEDTHTDMNHPDLPHSTQMTQRVVPQVNVKQNIKEYNYREPQVETKRDEISMGYRIKTIQEIMLGSRAVGNRKVEEEVTERQAEQERQQMEDLMDSREEPMVKELRHVKKQR